MNLRSYDSEDSGVVEDNMDFSEYYELESPIIEEDLDESPEAKVRDTVFSLCLFAKYVIPQTFWEDCILKDTSFKFYYTTMDISVTIPFYITAG